MPDGNPYFGEPWNASIAEGVQAPTPIGQPCIYCQEPIQDGDQGFLMPCIAADPSRQDEMAGLAVPVHAECLMRMVVGSVGHQTGRCGHFGGEMDDPAGMTKRQAARAACETFEARMQGKN